MTYLFITRLKDSAALVFCFSYIIASCIKSTFVLYISPRDYNENSVPTKTMKTRKGKLRRIYSLLG